MLGRKPARAPLSGADLADGIVTADKVAPDVATQAELDAKVPSQSGHSGKYLTTDATNSSWASVDALPVQSSLDGSFRKNCAAIGCTYDKVQDAFIPIKPHESWTLNEETCQWEAPTPMPDDEKQYTWNEATTTWDEIE